MKSHYDKSYYAWQKKAGLYGATQDLFKFDTYIQDSDTVLDFGCGGGYILEKLPGQKKYGVEINEVAAREAEKKGITIFPTLDAIPRSLTYDVIISHHALEHVTNPSEILTMLHRKQRKKGVSIHVVPLDDWRSQKKFTKNDINKHLFTWTPLNIGNLFEANGYTVHEVTILTHAWLPLSRFYFPYVPKSLYYFLCKIWSIITRSRQIRIVAS